MELLVAVAIIGITATIVAPALTSIMPDKNKMRVIKAHKILSEVTHELLNDPALYRDEKCNAFDANDEVVCYGLASAENPLIEPYNTDEKYTDFGKYGMLLASKMELEGEPDYQDSGHKIIFSTIDGTKWTIEDSTDGHLTANGNNYGYEVEYIVEIDLNGDELPNKLASKDFKNPDLFKFNVDTYGKVTGKDPLTIQYLKNPTKFNNKKADYEAAFGNGQIQLNKDALELIDKTPIGVLEAKTE